MKPENKILNLNAGNNINAKKIHGFQKSLTDCHSTAGNVEKNGLQTTKTLFCLIP